MASNTVESPPALSLQPAPVEGVDHGTTKLALNTVESPPELLLRPAPVNGVDHDTKLHENEFYRQDFGYQIKEQPIHTKRPMRMIIIGSGAAGLQVAYKAERQLENVTWQIYEKNDDVGGTWLENRYPGCCCDIPSHSYQYQFARNADWSSYYSDAEQIWRYFKNFAVKNDLERHVKFKHTVTEARWIDADAVWEVKFTKPDGTIGIDQGHILAACHGSLK